jgi:hypothetical protein
VLMSNLGGEAGEFLQTNLLIVGMIAKSVNIRAESGISKCS